MELKAGKNLNLNTIQRLSSNDQRSEYADHTIFSFEDLSLKEEGQQVLCAAGAALGEESGPLELLDSMLTENDSYAMRMKRQFAESGSIIECISGQYDY